MRIIIRSMMHKNGKYNGSFTGNENTGEGIKMGENRVKMALDMNQLEEVNGGVVGTAAVMTSGKKSVAAAPIYNAKDKKNVSSLVEKSKLDGGTLVGREDTIA